VSRSISTQVLRGRVWWSWLIGTCGREFVLTRV
jgi:hypothetical protein